MKYGRLIFWLVLAAMVVLGSSIVEAAEHNDDNQGGVAYGSAVNKDTSYASWDNQTYIDTYFWNSISFRFKVLIVTSDSVIFRTLGSNQEPDTLQYYSLIRADTIRQAAMGDSSVTITLPFGTASGTTVIPRYIKMEIFTYDADAGGAATATITDGWIMR